MQKVELIISKVNVYDEVAKTTSYAGNKKMNSDTSAYDSIFTTDDDRLMLERFWNEACGTATCLFKDYITSVSEQSEDRSVQLDKNYNITLSLPDSYDSTLAPSMRLSLFSYFTNYITSKWFKFINKDEAENYMKDADVMFMDVKTKFYARKRPVRQIPK